MIPVGVLARLRAETPGLAGAAHFNHAGASLMSRASLDAIATHLRLESVVGGMEAGDRVAARLEQARHDAATLLGADPDEIAFTSSYSHGFGSVFAALPPLRPGDRILVGRQEWGGSLATMEHAARRAGARIEVMPTAADGSVDVEQLAHCIDEGVRLLSLAWLPANGGLINDAAAVGRVAKKAGIPYFIDAAQAVGQIPVDVRVLQCDVLACPGRKHLRGPRGTGILYVRRAFLDHLEPAWLDVFSAPRGDGSFASRGDARRFETSEKPVALQLALGEAIAQVLAIGIDAIAAEIDARGRSLRKRLSQVPGLTLHDLGDGPRSGLVAFNLTGHTPSAVKAALAASQIYISANGVPYTPFDMQARQLDGIARASVSYLNDAEDIERLATALQTMRPG